MKFTRLFVFAGAAIIAALALTLATGFTSRAAVANTTVTVTEDDIVRQPHNTPPTNNWVLYTRDTGTGSFVVGPDNPPVGVGSLELRTPLSNDKVYLFNYDHIGTALNSIDTLGYATYRSSASTGSVVQVPAINLQVDVNGAAPGGFTTLVFEPVYNTAQGAIQSDTWQTWDAYNGGNAIWWSSNAIPGVCAFDCFVTWDAILAANPEAVIVGGFGVNQGGGNPGIIAATDALTIGYNGDAVTYNFDPYRVATTKDDCKVGNWQTMRRADGTTFRNQGQCVSYTNTGR